MNTLLLGGSGFIGSALARTLAKRGECVTSLSRGGKGPVGGVCYEAFDVYTGSKDLLSAHIGRSHNIVILFGQNGSGFDSAHELGVLDRVLSVLRLHSGKTILYCSSALVYGDTKTPASESSQCFPIDSYSKFKLQAERHVSSSKGGNRGIILRLANVYGSPENRGFVGFLIRKVFNPGEGPLIVNGDGSQTRDYVFVDDVVEACCAILDARLNSDAIVNVATGKSRSLLDVVREISRVSGRDIAYECSNIFPREARDMHISTATLYNQFGYSCPTSFERGIEIALERYGEYKTVTNV